jgi:hypothetical protein
MVTIYSIAIFLCLASVVLGEAVLRLCGYPRGTQLAPAVGFAVSIALVCAVFWLPGHAKTAAVVLALAVVLAVAKLARDRALPSATNVLVGLVVLGAVSIPFLVNRHVGIFGVSVDDDFAAHFTWASSLVQNMPGASIYPSYPLGPHELADATASLFGTSVEQPFTAMLLTLPVLTALTAQAVMRELHPLARIVGGLLGGLPYLIATHLGEGAFKELTMALLLLGVVLTLRQLQREGDWSPARAIVPGVMLAAILLVYGRTGLVWPLAAGAVWVLAASAYARALPSRRVLRTAGIFLLAVALCTFVASLAELTRIVHFSGGVPGGNVPTDASPFEVLGVWFSGDFRTTSSDVFAAGLLVGVALVVSAYALTWWTRRGDLLVPAAAVASLLLYVVVRAKTGPYLTSKALVIASTPTMLTLLVPVLSAFQVPAAWCARGGIALQRLAVALVAAGFLLTALWSSGVALRYARVGSDEHAEELNRLRALTKGEPTFDLMDDDFASWELREAKLSSPTPYGAVPAVPFALRKPSPVDATMDVDALQPSSLESFRYLVTTSSRYASEMPSNWKLVASTKSFDLWKRSGTTGTRAILNEGAAPGALLDCKTTDGRRLRRSAGVAGVWDSAPIGPLAAWTEGGVAIPVTPQGFVGAATGAALSQVVTLPAGRWELSLAYVSPAHLYLAAGALHAVIPSSLNLLGPYWRVGELTSSGAPVLVTLTLQQMRFDAALQPAAIGGLVAVRVPRKVSVVPLARACGRYVDWYEQRAASPAGTGG